MGRKAEGTRGQFDIDVQICPFRYSRHVLSILIYHALPNMYWYIIPVAFGGVAMLEYIDGRRVHTGLELKQYRLKEIGDVKKKNKGWV